jgi:AsmA protein
MQQTDPSNAEDYRDLTGHSESALPRRRIRRHLRRFWLIYAGLAIVLGLALLPPLINVNRFQRRITTSIGGSLGRPVHLDRISLSLLPLPGFEIQNLVVDEDPAFGAEPIIRANTVRATLRLSSLWRRRVEFSTISFTEPSLNLVHRADGNWNIESVLLQASHIDVAPTGQRRAGATPRFPYIEAKGARINFKQDQEKKPFSLIESEFALWSSDPNQWRLRLRARPTRTDSSVSDTGAIELEGTLGRGDSLAQIPINLEGQWRDAPLGEATRVLFGDDAGWRGNTALTANIRGTVGESAITSQLRLIGVRRADFVPQQPISADVHCVATATGVFHSYEDLRCSWAPEDGPDSPIVALTGAITDIRHPEDSNLQVGTSGIPASTVLDWLRVASPGISNEISATGKFSGSMTYEGTGSRQWTGQMTVLDAGLANSAKESDTLVSGDLQVRLVPVRINSGAGTGVQLMPASVLLGGHDPATLDGRFDSEGYSLHLTGAATEERLKEFAAATAPLGLGLAGTSAMDTTTAAATPAVSAPPAEPVAAPAHVDLISVGRWGDPHNWQTQTAGRRK